MAESAGRASECCWLTDVEANRRVVELFLKAANVPLVHAENGKVAVEKLRKSRLIGAHGYGDAGHGRPGSHAPYSLWEEEKREYRTPSCLTAHAFQEHRRKRSTPVHGIFGQTYQEAGLDQRDRDVRWQREAFVGQAQPVVVQEEQRAPRIQIPLDFTVELDSPVRIDPELEDLRPLFLRTVRDFQIRLRRVGSGRLPDLQRCVTV
jgi:CheY-like chemotaxis protein